MNFIVKNTTMASLFDLLAPHSCRGCRRIGKPICDCCKNYIIKQHQNFCPFCKKSHHPKKCLKASKISAFYTIGYRDGIVAKSIHDLKYSSARALAKPMAQILDHFLPKKLEFTTIVPLPTIDKHIRQRGLDHTKLIAKHLAKNHKNWKVSNILIRDQNTIQVGTDRKTRIKQATSAYKINPKTKIDSTKTYLVLDDVWTTGASVMSAVKKLRLAGAKKIIVAVLAVSE